MPILINVGYFWSFFFALIIYLLLFKVSNGQVIKCASDTRIGIKSGVNAMVGIAGKKSGKNSSDSQ